MQGERKIIKVKRLKRDVFFLPPPFGLNSSTLKTLSNSGTELSIMVTLMYLNLSPGKKSRNPSVSCQMMERNCAILIYNGISLRGTGHGNIAFYAELYMTAKTNNMYSTLSFKSLGSISYFNL